MTAIEAERHLIYEVVGYSASDKSEIYYGAEATREDAETKLTQTQERVASAGGKVTGYEILEKDVTGAFQMPPEPMPRARYTQRWERKPSRPGCWDITDVEILAGERRAATYRRDYPGRPPFEPFRQGDRDYALISAHYQATDVMDLASGQIVATEDREAENWGFCPVGFYVPDWRDVHDGSILPGSRYWEDHDEWPDGTLGFVWGCHWGDDNGWKVQALDLSGIAEGRLLRDERFGYLYLDSRSDLGPGEFIRCSPGEGSRGPRVTFSVPRRYDAITGEPVSDGTQ